MQVGMTKDQGLYNKPSAAVHPGALTAGTLPQYNNNPTNALRGTTHMTCINSYMYRHRGFNNKSLCILAIERFICGYKNERNIYWQVDLCTFVVITS